MKTTVILIASIVFSLSSFSQIKVETYGYIVEGKINNNDTTYHLNIKEVVVFAPKKFKNKRQARRYRRLVRNLKKVYPYAKLANLKLQEIETHLATIDSETKRKQYIKEADKSLRDEFEDELVKLTITQGRLLIKLIDRETGKTTYHLVKELKGNFSAFLWQSLARIFGENLKDEFDSEGEDKLIDQILIMIENGQL